MALSLVLAIVTMCLLLLCSALISGSEVAYFSLSPLQLEDLNKSKGKNSKRVLQLLESPKKLLATILIGNNFVNVGIVILSTFVVNGLFDFSNYAPYVAFLVQVVAVTFLILLIGEVIPKVYATRHADRLARFMAIPLIGMNKFFTPLSWALVRSTSVIDKRIKKKGANISVDELEHALELTADESSSDEEQKILKGIVKFGNTDVKQIMKPRLDVVAFEYNTSYEELMPGIVESGYSRIPIYKESFDKIVGILYIKDLLPYINETLTFEWQSLIRTPMFVPENKKIDDLLKEFQEKKVHLSIVVDEYGGTSGIVSLEDILEEIVGDITDEFDDDDLVYSKLDNNNYVFEGKTPLMDMYRVLNIDGDIFEECKGDSDTLAGFVLEQAGKIPLKNEKINFENYVFTIEAADKRRVKRIKVTIKEFKETDEA